MPIYRHDQTPQALKHGVGSIPVNPAMRVLQEIIRVTDPQKRIQRQMAYGGYVDELFGTGIGPDIEASGRRYQTITGPIPRHFKPTSKRVAPLTPLACLLAQSDAIDVAIAANTYHAWTERFQHRKAEWARLGIPSEGQNLIVKQGSLGEILLKHPNSHFDQMTCRFPSAGSGEELARLMLQKLNVSGTCNPNGASVLIGMKFQEGKEFAEKFDRVVQQHMEKFEGYELKTSIHAVGGAGAPAKLWRIVKTE